jgi:hypothetical protein
LIERDEFALRCYSLAEFGGSTGWSVAAVHGASSVISSIGSATSVSALVAQEWKPTFGPDGNRIVTAEDRALVARILEKSV